jgi:phosphoribosylformylglycinamidine cyclo-ligase
MRRTFNLGLGMVIAVPAAEADAALAALAAVGEAATLVGEVVDGAARTVEFAF